VRVKSLAKGYRRSVGHRLAAIWRSRFANLDMLARVISSTCGWADWGAYGQINDGTQLSATPSHASLV
jgi:hypothetical protein